MPQLTLTLFGGFAAAHNDQPITQFRTDKMRALLAYLAIHAERPFRRATLATLLWPDWPEADAKRNLRQSIHRLKALLDKSAPQLGQQLLTTTRQTIQLNQAALQLDVAQFQQHVQTVESHTSTALHEASSSLTHLQQAATLYQGELLAGLSLKDAFPFDEWLIVQREQLQHQALTVLSQLAAGYEAQEELNFAQQAASQQLQIAPWLESAHRQLMRIYAQQGQRTAALAQFESCEQILEQELGVSPSDETFQLWRRIRDGVLETAVSPTPTIPRRGFPNQLTPFLGRKQAITHILDQLTNPDCRLLTLLGPGGMGKTRLCIEVGQSITASDQRYQDGIQFLPLAAVQDEARLITTIAHQLGLQFTGQESPREQLLRNLENKAMLLICDNFEQLIDCADLLGNIVQRAPQVQLLVTSRQPLTLQAEWRVIVSGLSREGEGDSEAVRFFQRSAQRIAPHFQLTEADTTAVLQLCHLVDGLPLALEIAASWTRMMDCPTILQQTQKSLDFLTSPLGDLPARHQSIRAVLTQSWQMLSPHLRHVLGQLAHFAGSFTLEAAVAVLPELSMLDLARLLDKSLLQWRTNGRYAMHELLRQFALEQAAIDIAVARQHSHYFLTFVAARAQQIVSLDSPHAIKEIEQELDNVYLAWNTAVSTKQWPLLQATLPTLANYCTFTGLLPELETLLKKAIPAAQADPAAAELLPLLHHQQGKSMLHQGRYEEVTQVAEQLHDPDNAFSTQLGQLLLGQADQFQGRAAQAIIRYEKAATFFEQTQENEWLIQVYTLLGYATYLQSQFDVALGWLEQAFNLSKQRQDFCWQATISRQQGDVFTDKGQTAQALAAYQQALAISRTLNDRVGTSHTLHNLGRLHEKTSNLDEAMRHHKESLQLVQQLGLKRAEAISMNSIGIIYKIKEQFDEATRYFQEAIRLNRMLGQRDELAATLGNMGNVYKWQGNYDAAKQHLQMGIQIAEEINHPQWLAALTANLGGVYKMLQDWGKANTLYERGIELARTHQLKYFLGVLLADQVEMLLELGEQSAAHQRLEEGLSLAREMNNEALIARMQALQEQRSA